MKPKLDKKKRIPFYQQCASFIRTSIEEGRYAIGEFLPPERELSEQFGVNRLTLRKGLAELLRKGILESVPGAGNRVVMKKGRSDRGRLVGCVMSRLVGVRTLSPYYADIFGGIEAAVTEGGYNLVFSSVKGEDLWAANGSVRITPQVVNPRFAGVLIVGGLPEELARAYRRKGVGVVLVDQVVKDFPCVTPDNRSGAVDIARHLIGLGHQRIAFLAAPDDPVVQARFEGLVHVLKETGRPFRRKDYIVGGYEIRSAYNAMRDYLARNRRSLPTAVFAVNDEAAIGALKAVQESGLRVPRDVSIAGFDDIAWAAHTVPPLTTVRVPREEMGRRAARLLMSQLDAGKSAPATASLAAELVIRESCARPGG